MTSPYAAAIAAAAAGAPMSNGELTIVPGRLLLADGDGLCYYCAGDDETSPGEARSRLMEKLAAAKRASGSDRVLVLLTGRGSHKGYRYAVARAKPYQGQRENARRPKNWQYLREFLEQYKGELFEVEETQISEADDLFARYASGHPDCVIYTQDKDMRMVPGWHLNWLTHIMFKLGLEFRVEHDDKVWGRSWFWSQMLHGDTADHIPGLPWYTDGSITKSGPNKGKETQHKCGESNRIVVKELPRIASDMGALLLLQPLYKSCYGDRWLVELLEQGILLWMRNDTGSSALNVTAPGNPLAPITTHQLWPSARAEVLQRIAEAMVHEEAQSERDSGGEGATLAEERQAMRFVSASGELRQDSTGPLPLYWCDSGHAAPDLQCPPRQGGEREQAVRGTQPVGIPTWLRHVLAKA
jgi:DNA polymerase-1